MRKRHEHPVPTRDNASLPAFTTSRDYEALSESQREEVSRFYDQPIPESELRPMTPGERRRWRRIKKSMGRPRIGAGSKVISLSVERGLLARADAYAKQAGLKRAQLVAIGLELALAADARQPRPEKRNRL
jgi:hypothetical protein